MKTIEKDLVSLGKFLALVLRHKPEEIGITLDKNGWCSVSELLSKAHMDMATLEEIVKTDNKGRYEFDDSKTHIRACQGHSVKVDLGLKEVAPPVFLYHGTSDRFLNSIKAKGLIPGNRQQVHLSKDKETAFNVGKRHGGKTVILLIRAEEMYLNGMKFYLSNNGVWLTDNVPVNSIVFDNIGVP